MTAGVTADAEIAYQHVEWVMAERMSREFQSAPGTLRSQPSKTLLVLQDPGRKKSKIENGGIRPNRPPRMDGQEPLVGDPCFVWRGSTL